jgi:hypothetical protein
MRDYLAGRTDQSADQSETTGDQYGNYSLPDKADQIEQ